MKYKNINEAKNIKAEYDNLLKLFAAEATDLGAGLDTKPVPNYDHPVIIKRIAFMKKNLKILKKLGNETFDIFYKQRDF